jgi:hypothetical protein
MANIPDEQSEYKGQIPVKSFDFFHGEFHGLVLKGL